MDSTEKLNKEVRQWSNKTLDFLRYNVYGGKGKGDLLTQLKQKVGYDFGEVSYVGYIFPRHGVFMAKGVGRGHVMVGDKVIRGIKTGKTVKTISGTVNRTPVNWWGDTMRERVPLLADIIADNKADEAALLVKGVGDLD